MLDPKEGVSNANSVMSSTLIQDGASHSGSHMMHDSRYIDKSGKQNPPFKTASLLSDPGINPDELDENVSRK